MGSTNHPQIVFFLYSHHLSGLYCIDIVRRNSVLVMGVKVLMAELKRKLTSIESLKADVSSVSPL